MPAMPAAVYLALGLAWVVAGCGVSLPLYAFGPTGHLIAGRVAEAHLCPTAAGHLAPLLGGWSLATAGLWPDIIRADPAWEHSRAWHYLNVDDGAPIARATASSGENVLAALARFEARLGNPALPLRQRQEALRFVVHFIADLHQPLHVGRADDRGGNLRPVRLPGSGSHASLHAVWDGEALLSGEAEAPWTAVPYPVGPWAYTQPATWAEESRSLRGLVYALPEGPAPVLGRAYVGQARRLLRLRLAQAGIRLAVRLNAAMGCPRVEPPASNP